VEAQQVMSKGYLPIVLVVCGAMVMMFQGPASLAQESAGDTGPTTLIFTYKSSPSKRIALREYASRTGLKRFQKWKESGLLKDYRILFSRYVDADTWDMMALLSFARYADVGRWKEIERETPAGFTAEGLALTSAINTYPADLVRSDSSAAPTANSVFFIIPYDYTVPQPAYLEYVDGYVVPQMKGWMAEGVLTSYRLYLSRYPNLRPWGSMLVLEYKNEDAFGLREKTTSKVRARLNDDPAWKALSENKRQVRVEKLAVIADEILPP
jgi:hypothetical protein